MSLRHRSKILATIGPASNTPEKFQKLLDMGIDGVRLNTSHGSLESHRKVFAMIRDLAPEIPILIDLPGVKIRTGKIEEPISINPGDKVILYSSKNEKPDETSIPVDYDSIAEDVKRGSNVYINDGLIHLRVTNVLENVTCEVIAGGIVESRKGINLPGLLRIKVPTPEDKVRIQLAAELESDYLAISFVSTAEEVQRVRGQLSVFTDKEIPIISKIERQVALKNFDEILNASDGIMIARGDLGVEIPPQKVPIEQKRIIFECNRMGKPVIVATQMLDSMIRNPIATRAEVSDIFTAVDQGADTLMLSGETATGSYPIKSVRVMRQVAEEAHQQMASRNPRDYDTGKGGHIRIQELLGHAVKTMSRHARVEGKPAQAIINPTRGGATAKALAKYRPRTPMIAASPDIRVIRHLGLIWGITSIFVPPDDNGFDNLYSGGLGSGLFRGAIRECLKRNYISLEGTIIVVSSSAVAPHSPTNIVGVFNVRDIPV